MIAEERATVIRLATPDEASEDPEPPGISLSSPKNHVDTHAPSYTEESTHSRAPSTREATACLREKALCTRKDDGGVVRDKLD